MKIVLDTNVLVSGIFWGGVPLKILQLWQKSNFEIICSEIILEEYLKTIQKISIKIERPDLFENWSTTITSKISLIAIKKSFHLCRDPDDNKFIDCAVSGKAQYIISGDMDLLVLQNIMHVKIVTPRKFLEYL